MVGPNVTEDVGVDDCGLILIEVLALGCVRGQAESARLWR